MTIERKTNSDQTMADNRLIKNKPKTEKPKSTSSDKGNKSRSLNVESSRGDSSLTDRGGDEDVEIIEREIEEITVSDSEEPQPSTRKHASFLTEPKTIEILTMSDLEKDHEKDDTTDMYSTETFNEYRPRKVKFTHAHPSSVVEKVSLASVEPVDVTYELSLPQNVIDEGLLSAVQLEAVVYASQAHEIYLPDKSRAGFFIGDGAGVGKGRTVAGIIYENYQKGRKCALWFSVSGDLKVDAERDLRDIGASCIKIHNIAKMKYDDDISSAVNGNVTEGVIFSTYSTLVSSIKKPNKKYTSRLNQLIQWCGVDFDGVIIFDDFYKALDSYWSKDAHLTSIYVQKLQEKLPHARVVYASAAGASDPRHMAYMSRLGLWGTGTLFPDIGDFLKAVERRGESAMELVAMDMKQRGVYIARQLSFRGVDVAIKEVPMSDEFKKVYDDSTELWADARLTFVTAIGRKFDEKKSNSIWKQFWSAHKKFFRYLCVSAKTEAAAQEARRAVAEGKCVVIGLQTTGEARTQQLLSTNQHTTHFVSIAKDTFMKLVEKHFPTNPDEDAGHQPGDKRKLTPESSAVEAKRPRVCPHSGLEYRFRPPCDCREQELLQQKIDLEKKSTKELKEELLAAIEKLDLPPDPIDELIWRLGGPDQVAEMTGRVMRGVKGADGGVRYEARAGGQGTKKAVNLAEKDFFMDGVKTIAIISDAASSQISLHSDRRVKNQKQRVHITLQLPWSADQAVQQFGRTHRSNQVNAPEYIFLISDLAGERRFASTVAKRLESLGALTHGDRQATDSRDIRQLDIYNKYGRLALDKTMRAIYEMDPPEQMLVYTSTRKDFTLALEQVQFCDEKDFRDMTMFLKRILGIPVKLQNELFALFTDTFEAVVQLATVKGTLSLGVLEVYPRTRDNIQYVGCESFPCSHATGTASVKLHTLLYQPCMDWTNAEKIYLENRGPSINGFYKPKTKYRPQEDTQTDIMLCISEPAIGSKNGYDVWTRVYRPSTGRKPELKKFYLATFGVTKMWKTVKTKRVWETLYEASIVSCNHQQCDFKCLDGKNARIFYILSGSVLSVWKRVERVLLSGIQQKKSSVMKVVHLNTSNNEIVGIFIPARNISMLRELLAKDPAEFPKIENNQLIKKETNKDSVKIKDEPTEIETYMDLDAKLMYKPKKLDISDPWTKDLFKDFDNFYEFDDTQFFDTYRISKKAVLELWNMFDDIFKYRIFKGKMIKELAICLRYFATGVNYEKLAETCKVSKQFVARSIDTFTTHVLEHFPYYDCTKMPKTNEHIQKYKDEFFQIAHFPNVIGCIDHIHVNVTDTLNCGRSRLYNTSRRRYEKESTLHFLLVSDANTKVINVETGGAQDFVKSNSYDKMVRSYVKGPTSYLLGDSKFPLSKIIMTPVENPTTKQQQNYNNSHSKTMANTVKSLIYQLKCRFPPLALGIDGSRHNMTVDVFKACCLIHNLCIDMGEPVPKSLSSLSKQLSEEQSDNTYSGEKDNIGSIMMKEVRERIITEYFDGI